ncbi:hypothetical protein [Blastopirellula marina]|uniref:Uncharacterized protein n=1 Tax=Blastopirellula marina TaxID=124 RepID=A0A2S8GNI9_9BACT|nr:hypothetical protein [Blastopirellula marina]PQO45594.1 hypothetical protein C5Y93_14230 [Blastopirellula marina]
MASIFSTYSTGENRVTASFIAVLRSLSLDRINRLLGSLLEQSEFELIKFENQIAGKGHSVPDAMIQSNIRLYLETKVVRNSLTARQLNAHLEQLGDEAEESKILLVLTPDDVEPKLISEINNDRMVWASFSMLDQAIDEILEDKHEVVSEREAFLLRELQSMLAAEGLLASANDVLIVAARGAWPEYKDFHAYVCQANRTFQHATRLGFYSKGVIYPLVPKIVEVHDAVEMRAGQYQGELGKLVDHLVETEKRDEGVIYKVLLLSKPDSPETLTLDHPIPNDKRSKSGKPTAFTMGQRYVASEKLMTARTTSDLDS